MVATMLKSIRPAASNSTKPLAADRKKDSCYQHLTSYEHVRATNRYTNQACQ
ncbi:hypothetical protein Fuma_03322 [Fuerstiella marisgermanici]|uniref:Uncharacterized protein n=1 Tax=Fuerstiella marisgermanici TaxID=1891926 RepID=A0A1P8WI18_9PLAN|nr:hypothetical protein Fuma_03322 [Fuerstiella marisgermanici]